MADDDQEKRQERQDKDWEMARDAIKHEDGLVNIRLTWLINIHWILFGIFGVVQGALINNRPTIVPVLLIESALVFFFIFAIVMCESVGQAIDMAFVHIQHVRAWWFAKYPHEWLAPRDMPRVFLFRRPRVSPPLPAGALEREYPPVCGDFGFRHDTGSSSIPHLLARMDILMICCCLGFPLVSWHLMEKTTTKTEVTTTSKDAKGNDVKTTVTRESQGASLPGPVRGAWDVSRDLDEK